MVKQIYISSETNNTSSHFSSGSADKKAWKAAVSHQESSTTCYALSVISYIYAVTITTFPHCLNNKTNTIYRYIKRKISYFAQCMCAHTERNNQSN